MPSWTRKKYIKLAKGFFGRSKNCMRITIPKVEKSLQYAYISRRLRPRDIRRGWILNISSAVKEHSINYSRFIYGLNVSNIEINRKMMADLCYNEPFSFKAIIDEVKIQGDLKDKIDKEISYSEALERGQITETHLIYKPDEPERFDIVRKLSLDILK